MCIRDRYIWDKVCQTIRRWLDEGRTVLPISINVSRADIYSMDVVRILKGMIEKYNISTEYIEIEITESAYVENGSVIKDTEKAFKNAGFKDVYKRQPIWNEGRDREEELLANCYFNSMKLAMDNGIRSIAFPSISTGVYSFPVELAAKIAVHTVNRFLQDNPDCFDLVEWVLFDTHTESVYEDEVDKIY